MIHYLVKNLNRLENNFGGAPEYFTGEIVTNNVSRVSQAPMAFSKEYAEAFAESRGLDPAEAVVRVPDDTVVVLHESARQFPSNSAAGDLQQITDGVRTV